MRLFDDLLHQVQHQIDQYRRTLLTKLIVLSLLETIFRIFNWPRFKLSAALCGIILQILRTSNIHSFEINFSFVTFHDCRLQCNYFSWAKVLNCLLPFSLTSLVTKADEVNSGKGWFTHFCTSFECNFCRTYACDENAGAKLERFQCNLAAICLHDIATMQLGGDLWEITTIASNAAPKCKSHRNCR